jgi:choline monooxygenase
MRSQEWQIMRETNAKFWKEVLTEDVGVVEAMQEGRKADGFDGGHFSPVMDESTHHFHRWVARHFVEVG